jgi:hypothetical protein
MLFVSHAPAAGWASHSEINDPGNWFLTAGDNDVF